MAIKSGYREPKDFGKVMLTRRQWLFASTVAGIAACTPTASLPAATPTQAARTPVRGGLLRLPILGEPIPLNPVLAALTPATTVGALLFSSLTRIDVTTRKPVADLATGFEVANDGLSWVFHLQEKAKWHDGMDFTADDVLYTFQEVFNPQNASQARSQFANITKTERIDRNTVRFVLKEPLLSLPFLLTTPTSRFGFIPKHLLEGKDLRKENTFNNERPIGTGPFKVTSVVAGSHVEMAAFDDFYRGRPFVDSVVWKIVPDANVRVAQLKTGELHWDTIDAANLAVVRNDPNLEIADIPAQSSYFFQLNYRNALFQDKRVRQALIYGLDRKAMMDAAVGGRGTLMAGTIPPVIAFWYNADLKPYPYDVDKAKKLLADAGWAPGSDGVLQKSGTRLSFRFTFGSGAESEKQMAILAQQYWRAIGVNADVSEVDRAVYSSDVSSGTFVMTVTSRKTAWDPDGLRNSWVSDAGSNYGRYSNARVDELLKAAAKEIDPEKRKALYREYDAVIYEDAHAIHGFVPNELSVTNRKLKGIPEIPGVEKLGYIDQWYLEK